MARSASQFIMCSGILSRRTLVFSLLQYILVLSLVLDLRFGSQELCRSSATRRQESRNIRTAYGEQIGISNRCVSKIVVGVTASSWFPGNFFWSSLERPNSPGTDWVSQDGSRFFTYIMHFVVCQSLGLSLHCFSGSWYSRFGVACQAIFHMRT